MLSRVHLYNIYYISGTISNIHKNGSIQIKLYV